MDAFEHVVAAILDREGYWFRTSVKVALTPEEKRECGQSINVVKCFDCGEEYGDNGSALFERKCPKCQGGKPSL